MKKIYMYVAMLGLLALIALYGLLWYPHSAYQPSSLSLQPPSRDHFLGSDNLGIDIFAQISRGFFHSLSIASVTAVLAFVIGGLVGIAAGYFGGKIDVFLSILINAFLCVPQLPIMIVIGAFWGQSLMNIIIIISAFSWAPIAKIVRAKVMSIKEKKYITLAKSYGGNARYIVFTHMRREIMPILYINAVGVAGRAVVQEASLAFLGLSDPLAKSWGLMINRAVSFSGIYFLPFWKWWLMSPVLALMVTIVTLRLLSKAMESYFLEVM